MDKNNVCIDDLLRAYEDQEGEKNTEEKVYIAYKKISDESCEGALCKSCCCLYCCG